MPSTVILPYTAREPCAAIGDQQQRRLGARPEDDAMLGQLRRVFGLFVGDVHARVEPDRHHRAGGVGFDQADAHRLRHVAGILDFQDVRLARVG